MRPVRLVTQALGPYPDEQVLDFRLLANRTLFLIHGPTGAGKTTILDAISFALYGVCSGNERDVKRIRSDYADPAVDTQVTFDFKLGGEDYRIYRKPEQQRPKKRGQGTTSVRAEAYLWRRTGLLDDSKEGKLIASQWKTVNEAVEKLLGFRSDQFSQVVMLPQGQFRKLLLADSKERQAILEVLFQTALYREIEEALKQAAKEVTTEIREKEKRREYILEQAESDSLELLIQKHETARAKSDEIRAALDRLKIADREAQEKLNLGRAVLEKLEELNNSRVALKSFQESVPEFDEKRRILEEARKATAIAGEEKSLDQRQSEADLADGKLKSAREALITALAARDRARDQHAAETTRQPELEEAQRELTRLDELTKQVAELAEARERLAVAKEKDVHASERLDLANGKLEDCAERIESTKSLRAEVEKTAAQAEVFRMRTSEAEKACQQCEKLVDLQREEADAGKKLEETISRLYEAKEDAAQALAEHESLETTWIDGQAAILAEGLSPGAPCPVCGSTDHPKPAHSDTVLPDERTLKAKAKDAKRFKEIFERVAKEKAELETRLTGIQSAVTVVRENLGASEAMDPAELQEKMDQAKKDLKAAEEAGTRASGLEADLAKLDEDLAEARKKADKAEVDKKQADEERLRAEAEVDARLSGIPDELREMTALNLAKVRTGKRMRQLQEAFDKASQELAQAEVHLSARNAALDAAKDEAALAASRAMTAREEFAESLLRSGFRNQTHFKESKRSRSEIERLQKGIDDFHSQLASASDRFVRAEQAAAGLLAPDMESLEASAAQAEAALETALKQGAALDKEVELLRGQLSDYRKFSDALDVLEARYAVVGRISDVAGGTNREGITFHRFVLATLLDDVLFAASDRLRIMSNGRYGLQRVTVRTDRRTSFGLDLEVEDAYTGLARPVSTLSGGESFLASLSLALGLADVVQTYAGGIHLDTIFVDEGFGSLDPEALDLAFRALVDLQRNGRLVGIISHVPELRERIDTRLEVTTDRRGSKACFVVG